MLDPSATPVTTTTQPSSNQLVDNVNRIFSKLIPVNHRRDNNQLHKAIGVKSHGTITFADNKSNRAEFIRVPPEASVVHVKELLIKQWCEKRPSLVISITGGAKDYRMESKLLRAFRRGLSKVARTTGAWIITGGMNTGIMKLVGEIVQINPDRSRPIHLIGIATWGCVSNVAQLDVHGANVHYCKSRSEQKGEAPLEPNHTEFIFVDDGSERKYGREITFRARLEQAISGGFFATRPVSLPNNANPSLTKTQSLRPEQSDPVPVVLLVVEGGPNTVRTVHEAVVQNNIPAVFFEGTGRCCDLFAKALRLYNEYHKNLEILEDISNADPSTVLRRYDELKNKLREELRDEIRGISSSSSDPSNSGVTRPSRRGTVSGSDPRPPKQDDTDYFELVYECIDTRKIFLNVVSLTSRDSVEPDIDLAILQALLNATSGSDSSKSNNQRKREQFHLALEWNRPDIAKNYIMKNDRDWDRINLNDMFEEALERNQIEFVRLFLDHDFSLTDVFRDNDKLPSLYEHTFKEYYDFESIPGDRLRAIYREIIQPLIGDYFEVDVALHPKKFSSIARLNSQAEPESCSCCLTPWADRHFHIESVTENLENLQSDGGFSNFDSHMDVDKELFIWSVLTGRHEFNLLFWSRGKNKICAALVAVLIYRKRARKTNDESYLQYAEEFEKLAVQILDRFYEADTRACTKAIIRQIPAYGNVTWLELAISAEAKEFIAQKAVQDVLNNIWFGFIDQRETHTAIIFSTIMLWYSGLLRYHDELVKTNDKTSYLDNSSRKSNLSQHNQVTKSKHSKDKATDGVQMKLLHDINILEDMPLEFVDIGCFEKSRTRVMRYFRNILKFIRAPIVKYLYSVYFHVFFLLLFSYVILCDFFPLYEFKSDSCAPTNEPKRITNNDNHGVTKNTESNLSTTAIPYGFRQHNRPAITELILAGWVFTLFCEEIRQFFSLERQTLRNAINGYFEVFWNRLDFIAILLFYIGFGLRFLPVSECFCAARIILSVDLTLWFMRSLDIFAAVKRLGPKLVMIGEMANDLKFFMLMLTVFILGFGVSSYSLIYGAQKFSWHLPREIINLAYWQIFGELNALDEFEQNYNPNGYAVFILLVIYMAIVSILLVNLLIAMFSNTFNRLENDTDRIWKFQRYSLIREYLSRPSLPPPFIIFSHIWRFILYTLSPCINSSWLKTKHDQHTNRTNYKISLDEKAAATVEIAEDAFGDEVHYNYTKMGRTINDGKNQSPNENIINRMRILENRFQAFNYQQSQMFEYLDCLMDGLKALGGDCIRMPERRRFDPDDSFDEFSSNNDQSKRYYRRDSLLDDTRRQGMNNPDDTQTSMINFFPARRL